MLNQVSPSPASPPPAGNQASQPSRHVLASFELAVDLSDERVNPEYRAWAEEKNVDPEQYLWIHRIALSRRVEREVQDRLQLAAYKNHVRFTLKIQYGSITALATIFLVGKSLVDFVTTYKDFYDGLNLIIDQVQGILGRNVQQILATGGGPLPATSIHIRLGSVNTPDLPIVSQPRSDRRIPWLAQAVTRNLVRAAGILIVGIYLLSIIPATRPFMGELWPLPNLFHQILYLVTNDGQVRQANFTVANEGVGPADEVYINIDALQPRLTSYRIIPQEAYQIVEADLQKGVIRIALERMAAGSVVEVLVESDQNLSLSDIYFSVASKSGASQGRPPERRSDPLLGLRYIPPSGPLKQTAEVLFKNMAINVGQSPKTLTGDDIVAIILSPDFLRLAAAALMIAILAGMIFNSLVYQGVFLAEILLLTFVFFYPYQIPTKALLLPTIILGMIFVGISLFIDYLRGDLVFYWRGWRQMPYANFQTLVMLFISLMLAFLFLLVLAAPGMSQVSVVTAMFWLVFAMGAWIILDKIGLLNSLAKEFRTRSG